MISEINTLKIDLIKKEIDEHIYPANYRSSFILIPGSRVLGIYNQWYIAVLNETVLNKINSVLQNRSKDLQLKYWDTEKSSNAVTILKYFQVKGMQGKKDIERKISLRFIVVFKNNNEMQGLVSSVLGFL